MVSPSWPPAAGWAPSWPPAAGWAERAPLLDAHGARHCHGLAVEVKDHLKVRVHPLDDADPAELGEHCEEHV